MVLNKYKTGVSIMMLLGAVSCGGSSGSGSYAAGVNAAGGGTISCTTNQNCLDAMNVKSNAMCEQANDGAYQCVYWDSAVSTRLKYADAAVSCSSKSTAKTPWRLPQPFELETLCGTTGNSCNLAADILNEHPLNTGVFWAAEFGGFHIISFKDANEYTVVAGDSFNVRCVYTVPGN